jgi:hypothetical protein
MPDVVANVAYTGTWGSLQVSGAAHQIRSNVLLDPVFGPFVGTIPDTEYGWAATIQGGLNLPMLAPGDALWFAATYADGALNYLGTSNTVTVGRISGNVVDAFIDDDGEIATGEGWSVAGGLRHYWTPQIRQNVFGSYLNVEYDDFDDENFNEWRVGTNLFWQPVSGLDFGVEVLYSRINTDVPFLVDGDLTDEDDAFEGRIRVQRDF